jgi:DeoR family transcriptional regulator of aga operon
MEANLNRAMIRTAQKVVVLADSTKFGRIGFSKICETSDIDEIITDVGISQLMREQLSEMGIETTVVSI